MTGLLVLFLTCLVAFAAPDTDGVATAGAEAEPPKATEEADEPAVEYTKPERVKVGAYVNDVQSIDLKEHSYAMDAYIWFRWKNPDLDPATTMEFINPNELWGHILTPVYEEPEELPTGELYQVVRIQGRFSKKLPLFNYPLDRQELVMVFEDTTHELADLVYELDTEGLTVNPELVLPGYRVGEASLALSEARYPTRFGDPRIEQPSTYTRATISLPVSRPIFPYGIKLLVPVVAVILCAALMFLLSPAYVDSRVDVGITSLLTIVALQMTFNQDLPDVGYLMLMDKVYLCSYLFVIAGLGIVVRTTRTIGTAAEASAMLLHRRSLVALATTYFVGVATMILQAGVEG